MRDFIESIAWELRFFAERIWLVIKHRPWLRCPFCQGKGGEVSGYYEPEWTECRDCWPYYRDLEDHRWTWFVGRLPLLQWLRAKASIRFGLWYTADFSDIIKCKCGRHRWMDETDMEPGLYVCATCYEHKHEPEAPPCSS